MTMYILFIMLMLQPRSTLFPYTTLFRSIVGYSLLIGTPFFLVFGALSDRIGRKMIIMAGCLLAALTYVPIYQGMKANSDRKSTSLNSSHTVISYAVFCL